MSSLLAACRRGNFVHRSPAVSLNYRPYSGSRNARRNRFGTLLGTSAVIGIGTITWVFVRANRDRVFKQKIDDVVPGFAATADTAGDIWRKTKDYFKRQPSNIEKNNSSVVYRRNEAKPKPDLGKILKGEPSVPHDKTHEEPVEKALLNKPADVEKGSNLKGDEARSSEAKRKFKTAAELTPEHSDLKQSEEPMDSKIAKTKEAGDDTPTSVEGLDKSVHSSEDVDMSSTWAEGSPSKLIPEKNERKGAAVQVVGIKDSSSAVEGSVHSEGSSITMEGSSAVKDEVGTGAVQSEVKSTPAVISIPETPVYEDPRLADPSKTVELLEEAYEKFLEDCSEVSRAQKQLKEAWQDLYVKVTAPTDVEGEEQQISDAKQVSSSASDHLRMVMGKYKKSSSCVEELIKKALDGGHVSRASVANAEMKIKMAEIDLGLILMKEVIATARVAESYRAVVGRSKEKLQQDLEAASSLIDPASKDSLITSLSKKLKVLKRKLEEVDTEYARNMMIALEVQKSELDELSEKKLECSLSESEAQHESQLTKAVNEEAARYNVALLEQMRLAHEAHRAEKNEALLALGDKFAAWYSRKLEEGLAFQAANYQLDLAKAYARLAGIERMVDSVAEAGERTIRFQSLRKSCDSLVGNLEHINSDPDYDDHRYVLEMDFNTFREAAHGDPFIIAVLSSIPSQAIEGTGIQSEVKLRTRFEKVRRTCRGVALVPPEGAGPLTYLLSHVQSILTFKKTLLPDVIDYPELGKMNTYSLLYLAEKRMKTGDLEGVVDCMAYLKGEPKRIASDWLEDARLYLETRQAIELLQTYMRAKTFM